MRPFSHLQKYLTEQIFLFLAKSGHRPSNCLARDNSGRGCGCWRSCHLWMDEKRGDGWGNGAQCISQMESGKDFSWEKGVATFFMDCIYSLTTVYDIIYYKWWCSHITKVWMQIHCKGSMAPSLWVDFIIISSFYKIYAGNSFINLIVPSEACWRMMWNYANLFEMSSAVSSGNSQYININHNCIKYFGWCGLLGWCMQRGNSCLGFDFAVATWRP